MRGARGAIWAGVLAAGVGVLAGAWLLHRTAAPASAAILAAALVLAAGAPLLALLGAADRRRLTALHRLGMAGSSERRLGELLEAVRVATGAAVAAWLEAAPAETLRVRAVVGVACTGGRLALPGTHGLAAEAWQAGEAVARDLSDLAPGAGVRAAGAWRGPAGGQPQGVLLLGWRRSRRLHVAERAFAQAAADLFAAGAAQRRRLRAALREGVLRERARIARELHDGPAQTLTYLKIRAESALASAEGPAATGRLAASLEEMRRVAVQGLGDVRRVITELRASRAEGAADICSELAEYLRNWSAQSGVPAELAAPERCPELTAEVRGEMLRIVQEALANVRKHARARRVWVRLGPAEDGALRLAIADDGVGFDPASSLRPGHFGLAILHERAAAIGGAISIGPRPGGGTEVVLRVRPAAAREPGDGRRAAAGRRA